MEPFVDTHVHFWDLDHPELTYGWLQPRVPHPILGDIEGIKHRRYDATHLWAEARYAGGVDFVHVQAAVGTPDPVAETRWINEMAAATGRPSAHVAHADLARDDAEAVLDRHGEWPVLRGVRDFALEPAIAAGTTAAFDPGLRALVARGLLLDLDCEWPHMAAAADLARRHPDLVIVLEHLGYPRRRDLDYFAGWRRGLASLSAAPNLHCKISGIGMGDNRWTPESIAPWIDHCLESFGADRCVLGTNWPVDRLYSSYDAIVGAYREAIGALSAAEQQQVLSANARTLYRL